MNDFKQHLREWALAATNGKPIQDRVDALNLVEAIIDCEMTPDKIVEAIMEGTLPQVYRPAPQTTQPAKP